MAEDKINVPVWYPLEEIIEYLYAMYVVVAKLTRLNIYMYLPLAWHRPHTRTDFLNALPSHGPRIIS